MNFPSDMLETIVIGNIGSVRFVNAGKMPVLNLSIAASRRVGEKEYTDWTAVKVWGERAEKLKEHVSKGMKLLVRGRPEAKGFKRDDGTVAAELVLHANEIEFLSPKQRHLEEEPEPSQDDSETQLESGNPPPSKRSGSRRRS
jgi:single-stranded DNA-binding protein